LKFEDAELRNFQWYQLNGITYVLGREVCEINNSHGEPHVILEDGLKLEYDGLLLATGAHYEKRELIGYKKNSNNFLFLRNFADHQKLKQKLENIEKLVKIFYLIKNYIDILSIIGCNIQSLELAATIRKEYPKIDILIIDENERTIVEEKFGMPFFQSLVK
jgi:NAD(P)H-nitrite reductase large subunit